MSRINNMNSVLIRLFLLCFNDFYKKVTMVQTLFCCGYSLSSVRDCWNLIEMNFDRFSVIFWFSLSVNTNIKYNK